MRRLFLALLVGSFAFAVTLASAATMTVGNSSLGAGSGSAASCDTDGVDVAYSTSYTNGTGYVVSGATVSNITTPGCNGRTMGVTLADTANASLASASVVVAAGATSATVNFASPPSASSVANSHVVFG